MKPIAPKPNEAATSLAVTRVASTFPSAIFFSGITLVTVNGDEKQLNVTYYFTLYKKNFHLFFF